MQPKEVYQLIPTELPRRIDIEPTIRCNFRCIFCQRTYWNRRAPDMTFAQFKKIYDSFPVLDKVKVQGMGEPVLNKDLYKMLTYAREHNSWTLTYTNGSLLHRNHAAERLIDAQPSLVRISLDGGTQETFEKVRPGSSFDLVLENAARLVKARGTYKQPTIEFWSVGMVETVHELASMVEIAAKVEVDAIRIQMVMNTFEYKEEIGSTILPLSFQSYKGEMVLQYIFEARERAAELGVALYFEFSKAYSTERKCHWPFDSAFISVEGHVVPCCTIADPRIENMGNIFETSFEGIWTSENYVRFRRKILSDDLPLSCTNCYAQSYKILSHALDSWKVT